MIKNNSKDINSNDLNVAMLKAKLSGNEIKVILAYISKGGWKYGTEVFLPESVKLEYGLSDSTVKRIRKGLVEKGWMKPTGNKSQWGCDKYLITIPAPVTEEAKGGSEWSTPQTNLTPGVVHSDTRGRSERSTEVTKEVTKEVINNNKEEHARAVGASQSSGKPSDSTIKDNTLPEDKDNENTTGATRRADSSYSLNSPKDSGLSPIGLNSTVVVKEETKETRGVQNDLPLAGHCPTCNAPDFEAFCWVCG